MLFLSGHLMFDISEQHNRTLLTHEADGGWTVLLFERRDVLRTLALLFDVHVRCVWPLYQSNLLSRH